jgi:hypothetical protein
MDQSSKPECVHAQGQQGLSAEHNQNVLMNCIQVRVRKGQYESLILCLLRSAIYDQASLIKISSSSVRGSFTRLNPMDDIVQIARCCRYRVFLGSPASFPAPINGEGHKPRLGPMPLL